MKVHVFRRSPNPCWTWLGKMDLEAAMRAVGVLDADEAMVAWDAIASDPSDVPKLYGPIERGEAFDAEDSFPARMYDRLWCFAWVRGKWRAFNRYMTSNMTTFEDEP